MSRYARLRAAQRALAAAAPLPTRFAAGSSARSQLRELEASPLAQLEGTEADGAAMEPTSEWIEGLATVDGLLARYAGELRGAAEGIPGPQFRATLPPLLREDRPAVVGLLDLCVADRTDERKAWLQLIDYLVTLLAGEEGPDGSRRMAHDPAQVAPRLRRLCAAKAKRGDDEALRLAEEIRAATDALAENGNAGDVIQQVKAAKDRMGDSYFHPTLLRSVTAYNLAASNQLRARADSERAQDQIFYGRLGFDESQELEAVADDASPEPAEGPATEPESVSEPVEESAFESVLEARGIQALEHALGVRLLRTGESTGVAGELAEAMPVRELRQWERAAFGEVEEAASSLVRTCVTLGLALRLGDEARPGLAALGLDLDAAGDPWLEELDGLLQQAVKACFGDGDYERARNLQGTRGQWLPTTRTAKPIAQSVAEETPRETEPLAPAPPALAQEPEPAAVPPSPRPRRARKPSRKERKEAKPARKKRSGAKKSGSGGRLAAMVVFGVLLAVGIQLGMGGPKAAEGERHYVKLSELRQLSPDLVEAYTVERAGHKVFVATVSPSWFQLSPADRERDARSLGEKLGETGVSEVLLLDDTSRVEFHMVENTIRLLRP